MVRNRINRLTIPALATAALLALSSPALTAPTCQTLDGKSAKCGLPHAMPVGWSPSPQQVLERQAEADPGPTAEQLLNLAFFLGGLFALIALLPEFDGWAPGDWDAQEGDDDERS
jgi:hypothetical protein